MRVAPHVVTPFNELPGRVVAFRTAEIRPQVGGIVQRRLFEQGATIRAGQTLFQIDPAPFRADTDLAKATAAKAQVAYVRARVQAERLGPLLHAEAISRQSYDDAIASRDQARAELAEARAGLRRRQIDLGFSRVSAPISGRIGAANVTEGALVAATDLAPLAAIQQIDRVYVDVRQPAERYLALRKLGNRNSLAEIITGSGAAPIAGRILFSGTTVDPGTGEVLVRIEVPNPQEQLLPGMFVRVRIPQMTAPAALTVPQQAIARNDDGDTSLSVVIGGGNVEVRKVVVGPLVKGYYVVTAGLKPGETVIVAGQDRIGPGTMIKQRPWRDNVQD